MDFPPILADSTTPAVLAELETLAKPAVLYSFGAAPTSSTQSYVGGYPYMPEGKAWPRGGVTGEPMTFLMQVNFAELPPGALPAFPTSGLVQWFVDGQDDTYGLTFDGSPSREGLTVRFYPQDQLNEMSAGPFTPRPYPAGEYAGPFDNNEPAVMVFTAVTRIPHWSEYWEGELSNEISEDLSDTIDEWIEDSDLEVAASDLMAEANSIGGSPVFVQGDPRPKAPEARDLILQSDSDGEHFMWGDMGTAQLFGNLEEIRHGDWSSCWWDWACS